MEKEKNKILLSTTICAFLTPIGISSVNLALPAITNEFNISSVTSGWIITAYILMNAVFLAPFGKLGDIKGKTKIYKTGIFVYMLASFMIAISSSHIQIIFFRAVQGLGAAMMWSVTVAIIVDVFENYERGKAIGINTSAVYLGLSVGPFIGGFVIHNFGWRALFLLIGSIALLLFFISIKFINNLRENTTDTKIDFTGIFLYISAISSIFLGISFISQSKGIILIVSGLIVFSSFIYWELNFIEPIININLFTQNRVFTFSNLAALINYSATYAIAFLLSLYLQYYKGYNAQKAGFLLITQPLFQFLVSPFAGKLSDRIKPAYIASFGMFLTVVGLIMLIFINSFSILFLILALAIVGIGFGFFSAPNTNAIMNSVEAKFLGFVSVFLGSWGL